uniref:uncharacterized protein LOC132687244 n=1 Tax=Panthera onca TaxID=9690 RepID=UPI0029553A5B|nr:uncharacterized protein LOC132687244 [Panthera onca]
MQTQRARAWVPTVYLLRGELSRLSHPLELLQAFPGVFEKLLVQLVLFFNLLLKVTDHLTVPVIVREARGPGGSGVAFIRPFLVRVSGGGGLQKSHARPSLFPGLLQLSLGVGSPAQPLGSRLPTRPPPRLRPPPGPQCHAASSVWQVSWGRATGAPGQRVEPGRCLPRAGARDPGLFTDRPSCLGKRWLTLIPKREPGQPVILLVLELAQELSPTVSGRRLAGVHIRGSHGLPARIHFRLHTSRLLVSLGLASVALHPREAVLPAGVVSRPGPGCKVQDEVFLQLSVGVKQLFEGKLQLPLPPAPVTVPAQGHR